MTGPDYSKLIYLLIVGGILSCIGLFSIRNLLNLLKLNAGEKCAGRIVGKRVDSDDGNFYYVTYAFRDGVGCDHQKEIQLRKDAYAKLNAGQGINVIYQPGNPNNSYLSDAHFRRSYLLSICGLLLFAVFLTYIAYNFIRSCVMLDACPPEI